MSLPAHPPILFPTRHLFESLAVRLKMSENSLFAILLRSPWWMSFALALALALLARLVLPASYAAYAPFTAFPFLVIAAMAGWRQLRAPSATRVAATLDAVSAMSWREFSQLLQAAFERDGYAVTAVTGAADFALVKAGRTSLMSCKRWKAASHGLEPLRELEAARKAKDAHEAIYVAAGNMTENARRFAVDHAMGLMQGPELTRLLRLPRGAAKAAA